MKFHDCVKEILICSNIEKKFTLFDSLYNKFINIFLKIYPNYDLNFDKECEVKDHEKVYATFKDLDIEFENNFKIDEIEKPSYANFCKVVQMKDIKKHKTKDKKTTLLHNVTHIEYSAIDIALDACYRFVNLPIFFYTDWLKVAADEIRHFKILSKKLEEQGAKYGDLVVHDGLFIALKKTKNSLYERMAVIPRFMEANGLDANSFMLKNIEKTKQNLDLKQSLEVILDEEISHVFKGNKWFVWSANIAFKKVLNATQLENLYFKTVKKHYPNAFCTYRHINQEARMKAGFSKEELQTIQKKS